MRGLARFVMLAATLTGTAATAQTLPAPTSDTIVVNGKRLNKAQVRDIARGYTRAILALPQGGQHARWKAPICPQVIGLAEPLAATVIAKVRAEALAAGARVAKPRCKANFDIVFTDNVDQQMQVILRKSARFYERMSAFDRAQLTATGRPAKWFYTVKAEGANGNPVIGESPSLLSAQIEGGLPGMNARGDTKYLDGYSATLIGSSTRSNFDSACVIVDLNKAAGRELGAVAAYVALVGLAEIRMGPAAVANDTILTLFDRPEPSGDLTAYDRAFLKAVYSIPPNRERREQAGAITAAMVQALASQ